MIEPQKTLGLLRPHLSEKRNKGNIPSAVKFPSYLDIMAKDLSTEPNISLVISQVHQLTDKIDYCHLDYENIETLISYFTWQEDENSEQGHENSQVLIDALLDPTQAKLNHLIDKAKEIDSTFKAKGSIKTFLEESSMTCVNAVGFLLKSLFAVVAIPLALLAGCGLSCYFRDSDLITQPFHGYLLFLEDSIESIKNHAREVNTQFHYLTYNKATKTASTYARFFSSEQENNLDEVTNDVSLIV